MEEDEIEETNEIISDSEEGIKYLLYILKIEFDKNKLVDSIKEYDSKNAITNGLAWFFHSDVFGKLLNEKYGNYAELVYRLTILTGLNTTLISILSNEYTYEDMEEDENYIAELENAKVLFEGYVDFLESNRFNIKNFLPDILSHVEKLFNLDNVSQKIEESVENNLTYFQTANYIIIDMLNYLAPNYYIQEDRIKRGKKLIFELTNCKTGKKHWKAYEDICIKILNFLFVPPFSEVLEQSRTESGHTRRDGVLPNNKFTGFWEIIRNEFQSRHIICEFKNYATVVGKEELNQLRIYLSRPTVGRFGLLFLRNKPSKKLLEARKIAYEEGNILILLLDDEKVIDMIKMGIFSESPEEILEDLKVQFELTY